MIILLPHSPSRVCLRGFWLAISLFGGLLTGILSWLLLPFSPWMIGAALVIALAVPGIIRPEAVLLFYRAWNKLTRVFARVASTVLLGICFYVIFAAMGRLGSSLKLASDTVQSHWVARGTLAPTAYSSQYAAGRSSSQEGWIRPFLSWAANSGNWWACCLIPFFVMLTVFKTDEEKSAPSGIYTLF